MIFACLCIPFLRFIHCMNADWSVLDWHSAFLSRKSLFALWSSCIFAVLNVCAFIMSMYVHASRVCMHVHDVYVCAGIPCMHAHSSRVCMRMHHVYVCACITCMYAHASSVCTHINHVYVCACITCMYAHASRADSGSQRLWHSLFGTKHDTKHKTQNTKHKTKYKTQHKTTCRCFISSQP